MLYDIKKFIAKYLKIKKMKLPKNKREKVISDLKIGEYGYVVPWAMCVDNDMECFIKTNLALYPKPTGKANLKIKRLEDGYITFIHDNNYEWQVLADYEINFDSTSISPVIDFNESKNLWDDSSDVPFHKLTREALEQEMGRAAASDNFEKAAKIRNYLNSKSISN